MRSVQAPVPLENRGAGSSSARLVKSLFREGRLDLALAMLDRPELCGGQEDPVGGQLWEWLSYWYPAVSPAGAARRPPTGVPRIATGLEGPTVLSAFLGSGGTTTAIGQAEEILRRCMMVDGALESLIAALTTLLYADRADLAARWSMPLLEQTTMGCSPEWHGAFAAMRAETAVRQGRLAVAVTCGTEALTHVPIPRWGVSIGLPVASIVNAKLGLGLVEDAIRYLALPVPETMFQTPFSLHYLCARGRCRLATGEPAGALSDFLDCGRQMAEWGIDLPGLETWRVDAGRAALALGRLQEARALAEEQLRLLPGLSRARGKATGLLADVCDPDDRHRLLGESVESFQHAGDQFLLSGALRDLARSFQASGQSHRARAAHERADGLAAACAAYPDEDGARLRLARGVAAPPMSVRPPVTAPGSMSTGPADSSDPLSQAERRVAVLAARGATNQQIAEELFITVSTVEQHLTRIYRKLGVSRRVDLPALVGTVSPNGSSSGRQAAAASHG
jgi:DNA-binding CsgD family transcriptional regulator/tetratricopeptide (TPR) repeat protein